MKKSLIIPLILILSTCLFVANAFSGSCDGGASCLKCGQMDHHHATGPETDFVPYGCEAGTPNSACGIAPSRLFENSDFLISAVRVDSNGDSALLSDSVVDHSSNLFSQDTISLVLSTAAKKSPPIYLRNLSFLC